MFCYKCGKEVEDGVSVCPECGAVLSQEQPEKKKLNLHPIDVVCGVFSLIAFVMGIILMSCTMAGRWGADYIWLSIVPAFAGLGIGVYRLVSKDISRDTKSASLVSVGLSGFVLLFAFITNMVVMF